MSEVEKMYVNAGVEKRAYYNGCPKGQHLSNNLTCYECEYFSVENPYLKCSYRVYPPFTAEKQLSLIKFLFNHNVNYDVDDKGNYWFHITDDCYTYYYNKFEIALANIINEMWQDLTEQDRTEIADILKG